MPTYYDQHIWKNDQYGWKHLTLDMEIRLIGSEMANRLREFRQLTGLSQRGLADLAKVKHSAVADVETHRIQHPSHDFVVKVLRALRRNGLGGVTAEQVFPVSDDEAVAS